jgi:transketolase
MGGSNLQIGKTNLDVFAQTLMELAASDREILIVTSDSRGSGRVTPFAEKFPEQIVEIGIAEQNLVGVAAGLASAGKKVFIVSPACFLTARALEQIKNDVAYSDHPVKVVGISAGVSYGSLGTTHHSLHDFAVLQAINNIIAPATILNSSGNQAAVHHRIHLHCFGEVHTRPSSNVNLRLAKPFNLPALQNYTMLPLLPLYCCAGCLVRHDGTGIAFAC